MPDFNRSTQEHAHVGRSFVFTSESGTEGHPDKIADQISDAILDAILEKEATLQSQGYISPTGVAANVENVRCACETLVTTGSIIVSGEIRTQAYVDVPTLAREVLREIGYDRAKYGFDCDTCGVLNAIHDQSPDIAQKYGVMSVPTLAVFKGGKLVNQAVGVQPKPAIMGLLGM